ncbi:hypothetical protein HRI_003498200 [Hibiscus trionum]|uniref:C2H2-type domain-containing protein n=1 Tax=Hibiscus trionum TaxID=183268 RepID=A0A9W7ILH0_HIBTR|nr:hypothetical protein HRI_003498200 [Hibiscus trionum]
MAFVVDQQSEFKYFCKICNKGFRCGRALGGHMRSHGLGDESRYVDEDDTASDWEDKLGGNIVQPGNKRMYGLRTNPNRLKSCRVCENCGKELFSWKSFLEHGKCSSRDVESSGSSQGSDGDHDGTTRRGAGNLSKRKRSLVSDGPSSEEEDAANCLMMLSNAIGVVPFVTEPQESCTSASKEEERRNALNFVTPMSCRSRVPMHKAKGIFECKACKKVFNSHQALGGHRASHKKVKGCFAARLDNDHNHRDDSSANDGRDLDHDVFFLAKSMPTFRVNIMASASKKKPKVHQCSICHRVFSSGQALGGHKRCHWITSNPPADHMSSSVKFHRYQDNENSEPLDLKLDLSLTAPANELVQRNHITRSSFDVSTKIYLQPWIGIDAKEKEDNLQQLQVDNKNNNDTIKNNICNNMSGSSFPWLQVGIVSTTNVGSDPYIL